MNRWQAVFFDFDGVILDSVQAKTRAFACMFRQYGPEIEQAVVAYHLAHGGVSRFEKFKYYYNHLLLQPVEEEELEEMGKEFSRLALDEVMAAPFIPEALETLQRLLVESIPAYVVSGTPEEELRYIVAKRGLNNYFREIHGAPRQKTEILQEIIGRYGYVPQQCLFLGDAMTDYEAAAATGTCFVGIVSDGNHSPFPAITTISSKIITDC